MVDMLRRLHARLTSWTQAQDDEGASLVEYALLVALIAVVCFVAVQVLGETTSAGFEEYGTSLNAARN